MLGNVTLQIVRDWVPRFNTEGPAGLIDREPPGQPRLLLELHRQALMAMIESGPMPAIHGVVRCRPCDRGQWLWGEFRISGSKQTLSRELRAMGLRKLSARPEHHTQTPDDIETFKKTPHHAGRRRGRPGPWPRCDRTLLPGRSPHLPKNKITRRWARRGIWPSAPQDQCTASTSICGAVCPHEGKGAAFVLPFCNTAGMSLNLAEISRMAAPGRHAVLLLDQAGGHLSAELAAQAKITLPPLPAKCPELNVTENVWQFMRDKRLSNRIFTD